MSAPFAVWAGTDEGRAVIAAALAYRNHPADPDAPFITARRVEHDGTRRVLAVGRTRGGSALLQLSARSGDFQATGMRKREPGKAAAREKAS